MLSPKLRTDFLTRRRLLAAFLAAELVGVGAVQVGSERLSLQAYYPSPIGIYATLTTTDRAVLARDGGSVGIGTSNPTTKLDVRGDMTLNGAYADTYATRLRVNMGNIHVQGNEAGGAPLLRVGNAWNLPGIYAEAGGDLVLGSATGWVRTGPAGGGQRLVVERTLKIPNPVCVTVAYSAGVKSCPAGQYATYITGLYPVLMQRSVPLIGGSSVESVWTPSGWRTYDAAAGTMFCCTP